MVPDGRPAARFVASLVLIALSLGLAWSIAPARTTGETATEARVAERARHAIEEAIGQARAAGDGARVRWLEETLECQEAFRGRHPRHNAGAAAR
jgi:hypothetical protein